jgi:hypothetical protein
MEMDANFSRLNTSNQQERRLKPRVRCSYPASLRGHDSDGLAYESKAVLLNMSASGMYLRLKHAGYPGEMVVVQVRLSTSPLHKEDAPQIYATGQVTRIEPRPDGTYGLAVRLLNYRFL